MINSLTICVCICVKNFFIVKVEIIFVFIVLQGSLLQVWIDTGVVRLKTDGLFIFNERSFDYSGYSCGGQHVQCLCRIRPYRLPEHRPHKGYYFIGSEYHT